MTPFLGVTHQIFCISHIDIMIHNSKKISYEVAAKIIFVVRGVTTRGTVLKGCSISKVGSGWLMRALLALVLAWRDPSPPHPQASQARIRCWSEVSGNEEATGRACSLLESFPRPHLSFMSSPSVFFLLGQILPFEAFHFKVFFSGYLFCPWPTHWSHLVNRSDIATWGIPLLDAPDGRHRPYPL